MDIENGNVNGEGEAAPEDDAEDDSESERGFIIASQVKPEQINKMDKAVTIMPSAPGCS